MKSFASQERPVLSIECGTAGLVLALVVRAESSARLEAAERVQPGDTVDDFSRTVRSFLQKQSPAPRDAVLTFGDTDAVSFKYVTLPVLPRKELRQAVEWQLRDSAAYDPEKKIADVRLVHEAAGPDGARTYTYLCTLFERGSVEKALTAVRGCGLRLRYVTAAPWNYSFFIAARGKTAGAQAVLDIGMHLSTLTLFRRGHPAFIRNLPFSCNKFSRALIGVLQTGNGRIELDELAADTIRDTVGIPGDETVMVQENVRAQDVVSLLLPALENIVKDIRRSCEYFVSHFDGEPLETLYLSGRGASIRNLDAYLSRELGLPVAAVEVRSAGHSHGRIPLKTEYRSAVCAALGDGKEFDILPLAMRERHRGTLKHMRLKPVIAGAAVFCLCLWGLSVFQERGLRQELQAYRVQLEMLSGIKELKMHNDIREQLLAKLKKGSMPADEVLSVLTVVVPEGILLDQVHADWERNSMTLKGSTNRSPAEIPALVSDLITGINQSGILCEARLVWSRTADDGRHEFEVSCAFKGK